MGDLLQMPLCRRLHVSDTAFNLSAYAPCSHSKAATASDLRMPPPKLIHVCMCLTAGDVVLGVLTVASTQPHAYDEVWEDVMDVLAVGILTSLRMEAMQYITRILEAMDLAEQPQDFIGLLLQGGGRAWCSVLGDELTCRSTVITAVLPACLIAEVSVVQVIWLVLHGIACLLVMLAPQHVRESIIWCPC